MLEKPDLPDDLIVSRLRSEYGLPITRVDFLPLGYDVNSAVYRASAAGGLDYFLKLRKGRFDSVSVTLPQFLRSQGIRAIIPILETSTGQLWGSLGEFKLILYPYIEGKNGYEQELSQQQWIDFGKAVRAIHAAQVPRELGQQIPRETYPAIWREQVKAFQAQVEQTAFDEPVASKLAAFMRARRAEISHLVERAGELGRLLRSRPLEFVLCHADIHPGNLLIGADGALYIVDWDNPIFAPKECDLMFVGGGISDRWYSAEEEAWFYQGYGPADVDRAALAYYRYERIVADIAAFCEQLLLKDEGGEDREQAYRFLTGQFLPGQEVEIALRTDVG